MRFVLGAALVALGPRLALCQHAFAAAGATYDSKVPTPRAVLGYEIGERFTPHHMIMRYVERVAGASARVRVDTMARTFEGRELLLVAVSSEANIARLAEIRSAAQRLADPRGATAGQLQSAQRQLPAIVWLAFSVHGGEASGTEAALAMLYQLAAGTDAETRLALDSAVVLIDPSENPDGHERHVHDVQRMRGAGPIPTTPGAMIHQGSWPGPRTSHYYFDLNRDWFIQSHPETRGRTSAFQRWWPHVAVDLHEMGTNSTFYFAPPMEPNNKNNPAHLPRWFDTFAASHAEAFDRRGWSFFRREGYDSFYPGYGEAWPMLTGAIGMLFEVASSQGGAARREDGTIRTLRDAVWQHYTAAWSTVITSARRAGEIVRDYAVSRQSAISIGERGPMRAVVLDRDSQGRADSLAQRLRDNGITVHRLRSATDLRDATEYGESAPRAARVGAGAYVVDFAQPQGHLAKALLEPDAELDSAFIRRELESRRTAQPDRFYDVTAWSMPFLYRVRAWIVRTLPAGLELTGATEVRANGNGETPAPNSQLATPNYGYAFEPGSETSVRMLASLLADSVRVWYAPKAFKTATASFPRGAFVVRVSGNDSTIHGRVSRYAQAWGAKVVPVPSSGVVEGTDLGSNSVFPVRPPRVALLGGTPVSGTSFGFAWYAFDQRLGYPVSPVDVGFLTGGALDQFDVLVVPSVASAQLERLLGDAGRTRIAEWVRAGGALIALDGASAWLASERLGLARARVRRDSTRADSAGGAALPSAIPGAIVRATADTLSPLLAGVFQTEFAVFVNTDRILTVPKDLAAGDAVIRFAPEKRLRLSGYLWPETIAARAGAPYLWTERVGRGRIIAFAEEPNFRDSLRGMLPIFANAVFLGGNF